MKRTSLLVVCLAALPFGCGDDDGGEPDAKPREILDPEPAGAPTSLADGRLTCLDNNAPADPTGAAVELTGYVRTFADPAASADPPAAQVEAFTATGTSLATGFADSAKDGRISVSVPIGDDGFTGYVKVTDAAYLPYRFQTNRGVTQAEANGWTWLVTQAEVDSMATDLGVTQSAGNGIVVGSVHDCDNFGVAATVVQVNGETDGVFYTAGFTVSDSATYTDASGRFVVPNVPPGTATIKAFGRLANGGKLTLLSSIQVDVTAGEISAVGLQLL